MGKELLMEDGRNVIGLYYSESGRQWLVVSDHATCRGTTLLTDANGNDHGDYTSSRPIKGNLEGYNSSTINALIA
jgi:hypothetical protein